MNTLQSIRDFYLEHAVPINFYKLQKKPKGSQKAMTVVSLAIYILAAGTFAAICYSQSLVEYAETKISTSDDTANGYTCSMASIYNSVPQQLDDSTTDPADFYQLYNLNELGSDCMADLTNLQPCDQNLLYSPGAATSRNKFIISSSSFVNNTVSFIAQNSPSQLLFSAFEYNIDDGTVEQIVTSISLNSYNFASLIARFGDNCTIYIQQSQLAMANYGYYIPITVNGITVSPVMVANDNFYNLYVIALYSDGKYYVFQLFPYFDAPYWRATAAFVSYVPVTLITSKRGMSFTVYDNNENNGNNIQQVSVYVTTAGSVYSLPIHTTNNTVGNTSMSLLYPAIGTTVTYTYVQTSIDGSTLFANSYDSTNDAIYLTGQAQLWSLNATNNQTARVNLPTPGAYCFQLKSTPVYIFGFGVLRQDNTVLTSCYLSEYDLADGGIVLYNTTAKTYVDVLYGYIGSNTGWFTCGSNLETAFPNNLLAGGAVNCTSNGILWRSTYSIARYYTAAKMKSIAIAKAAQECTPQLYTTICTAVGKLPPYICTKQKGQPILTLLSTALANTSLLFFVLVTVTALFLPNISELMGGSSENDNYIVKSTTDQPLEMRKSNSKQNSEALNAATLSVDGHSNL